MNIIRNRCAMTLVEVLVAMFILTIGIFGSLMFFTTASESVKVAGDMTVATSHAEYVLEEMQVMSTLGNILSTDWTTWAGSEGLDTLDSESVTVVFANSLNDPLDVTVSVAWETQGRASNVSLRTELTK